MHQFGWLSERGGISPTSPPPPPQKKGGRGFPTLEETMVLDDAVIRVGVFTVGKKEF